MTTVGIPVAASRLPALCAEVADRSTIIQSYTAYSRLSVEKPCRIAEIIDEIPRLFPRRNPGSGAYHILCANPRNVTVFFSGDIAQWKKRRPAVKHYGRAAEKPFRAFGYHSATRGRG